MKNVCSLANRTVAEHVQHLRDQSKKDSFPFFYRIHDRPDEKKLADVLEQVRPLGISFEMDELAKPSSINHLLESRQRNTHGVYC